MDISKNAAFLIALCLSVYDEPEERISRVRKVHKVPS